jgi:hypothetical protein
MISRKSGIHQQHMAHERQVGVVIVGVVEYHQGVIETKREKKQGL